MIPVGAATAGYLTGLGVQPLGVASDGYLALAVIPVPPKPGRAGKASFGAGARIRDEEDILLILKTIFREVIQ